MNRPKQADKQTLSEGAVSAGYDPLGTCPQERRVTYSNMALKASQGSFPSILRLKCLECCGWNTAEPGKCEIRDCALWAYNRKDLSRAGGES